MPCVWTIYQDKRQFTKNTQNVRFIKYRKVGLLNKENKTKSTNIFSEYISVEFIDPSIQELVQNILNELPIQRIISRHINYCGKILTLDWDFDRYQRVSRVDIINGQGVIKSKVHTGFSCRITYMGYTRGKILFDDKLLENSMIYNQVLNLRRDLSMMYSY